MLKTNVNYSRLIVIDNKRRFFGGNQEWYPSFWQRQAGCGPTAAATIAMYERRRQDSDEIWTQKRLLQLMLTMWDFVTPQTMGLSKVEYYATGYERYLTNCGTSVNQSHVLNVPTAMKKRPALSTVIDFLAKALQDDQPVAFLNWHNGGLSQLESWHWVTIAGLAAETDEAKLVVTLSDGGLRKEIDLARWLTHTTLGGGFVYFEK